MPRLMAFTLTAAMVAGCSHLALTPVPVQGTVQVLVGEWSGDYSSPQSGRKGTIMFHLHTGQDTASGEVVMLPWQSEPRATAPERVDEPWWRAPATQVLSISFVRCEGNEVSGWLDPYPDPESGDHTYTTFTGIISGDELRGTYVSWVEKTGRRTEGTWSARRVKTEP